jgi:hypothetical protein
MVEARAAISQSNGSIKQRYTVMTIYRETLDAMPCGHCGQKQHGPMFLHSACHPGAPSVVYYNEGVVFVKCSECKKTIVNVAVEGDNIPDKSPAQLFSSCHPDSYTWVQYEDGKLRFTCSHCDQDFGEMDVASVPESDSE